MFLALIAAGVGSATWWLAAGSRPLAVPPVIPGDPDVAARPQVAEGSGTELAVEARAPSSDSPPVSTTVLWPLVVELELTSAAALPVPAGQRPIGAERQARLAGQIADASGNGALVHVRFVHGPNRGRELASDSDGRFGASDLWPGIDIVEIDGPAIAGSRREILLRQNAETLLNIGYGAAATVTGKVVDPKGEPIAGAQVMVDGHSTITAEDGWYSLSGLASGETIAEVSARGYASLRRKVNLGHARLGPTELVFGLRAGTRLTLALVDDVGGPGPAQVWLLPGERYGERVFPWYSINPVEVSSGSVATLEDLPVGVVLVRAFRSGARAPQAQSVNLRPGMDQRVEIRLEPGETIVGVVTQDGEPVAGARVRSSATDRVNATLAYFREPSLFLESEVLPHFPPASEEVVSGPDGRFQVSAWSDVSPLRYLEARGPDGRGWARALVAPKSNGPDASAGPAEPAEPTEIELELGLPPEADGELVLLSQARTQGLPVRIVVNGAPREELVIAPHEDVVADRLAPGTWKLTVRWYGELVDELAELAITGRATRRIELPRRALDGHTAAEWRRAGRVPPPEAPEGE